MPPSAASVTPRIHDIVARLSEGLVERDQMLRVALLGTIAGENVLLLGPPGTAKSLLARRMAGTFADARYFQYMLTRFTSPDELFGPVSLRQLKERDEFRRKVEGYLPLAEVAFIDEIFKASSAILNSLLTLLNERLYFNGGEVLRSPLLVLVAASNEVPAEDELAALFDRFTVRLSVPPIVDDENVLRMLRHPEPAFEWSMPAHLRLSPTDVQRVREEAKETSLSKPAERVLLRIKKGIEALAAREENDPWRYYVSDRRWRQAVRFVRTAAFLNGRDSVHAGDCALLRHCLWNRADDEPVAFAVVEAAFEEAGAVFGLDLDGFVQRWLRMLSDLRDREGIARPIWAGYTVSHGGQKYVMTDLRAADAMQNTFESIRATGFYFDQKANMLRRVRLRADGGIPVVSGFNTQAVSDATAFQAAIRAGGVPQFEEGSVTVERRTAPGIGLDFAVAPTALRDMYQRELGRLLVLLEEIEGERKGALEELDETMADHLFVPVGDTRSLRAGLVRAELAIREWEVKVRTLVEAVKTGGTWEGADVDFTPPGRPRGEDSPAESSRPATR